MTTSVLPTPIFIDTNADTIRAEMVAWYEQQTNKTLYPAQIESLFIEMMTYRERLLRIGVQAAAMQNLVRFADSPMLDYLGELVNTPRLPALPALCVAQFIIPIQNINTIIPAGTRFGSGDVIFTTLTDVVIPADTTTVTVDSACSVAGSIGNGFAIGALNSLIDLPQIDGMTVANIDVSSGGVDIQSDDSYRQNIIDAPEGYTTAGSVGAYIYHAKRVSQSIVDVVPVTPHGGEVDIYVLTETGLPSATLIDLVYAACNADKVRPLTDLVKVLPPVVVPYEIVGTVDVITGFNPTDVVASVNTAAQVYGKDKSATLGLDIVLNQLKKALMVLGVYDVHLTLTDNIVLDKYDWAVCININLTLGVIRDA